MTRSRLSPLVFLAMLFLAAPSRADIYKYTDRNGQMRVVDELQKVPAEIRRSGRYKRIKERNRLKTLKPKRRKDAVGSEKSEEVESFEERREKRRKRIEYYRKEKERIEEELKDLKLLIEVGLPEEGVNGEGGESLYVAPLGEGEDGEEGKRYTKKTVAELKKELDELYKRARKEGITRGQIR